MTRLGSSRSFGQMLIRIFLDYELPEIQEFRHAQSQFKTDLPTVLGVCPRNNVLSDMRH